MDMEQLKKMHGVWHAFQERFMNKDGSFKDSGYSLNCDIGDWVEGNKQWKDQLHLIRCDDQDYTGSFILLIVHENETNFHGTTLITLPQHGGKNSIMFLYPDHAKSLVDSLNKIKNINGDKLDGTED